MLKRFLYILSIITFIGLQAFPQVVNDDIILREMVGLNGQAKVTIPYTNLKDIDNLTKEVSILSVNDKLISISLSQLTVEWFIDQKFDYSIVESADNKGIVSALNVTQAMEWNSYPTYSQYDSIMQDFVRLYPDLCDLDTIGTTIRGKLVLALKISDNASTDEDEPETFYTSTIHGDETGGYIMMLRLADYLLRNYNLDSRVKNLVDNLEIWINPLANPDGTYGTGNIISSPSRYNANGIDLNRNFPDPFQPLVVQTKENQDMIKFMRLHKFVISANFHSGFEIVNYPWDRWLSKIHADESWFYSISRAYADTVHAYSVPAYMSDYDNGFVRGAVWYVIYGGRQDFVTYELQGREVTVELDDAFITPAAQLELLWNNNWHSLIGYLENALYGIHGKVRNATTLVPVPAKIFINNHDIDNSNVYSDTLTGNFIRLLSPGSWDILFTAKGFLDTTYRNILVFAGQKTDMIVDMVPIVNSVDTTNPEIPVLYPNPVSVEFKAVLPSAMMGKVNIRIINPAGKVVSDYNTFVSKGDPPVIDVRHLSGGVYTVIFTGTDTKTRLRSRFIVIK
jgi:hypothetical protein